MKKIAAFILLLALTSTINAQGIDSTQTAPAKTPEKNKDRLMMSMYNCFWQGLPTGVEQRGFSQGYNFSLLFDIPTSENSPVSFGLGIGYMRNHLYSNAITKMDLPNSRTTIMTPISASTKYNTNKLTFTYLSIPLELRLRSKSNFRVALGLRSNIKLDAYTKYYGHNPDALLYGQDGQVKAIRKDVSNTQKYLFELTARVGWKFISVNGSYGLTKLFTDGKGPQISPYTLGVTLSLW